MDQVAQIRAKIDLVSLIQEYVPLKKAGRNFKANCPFHGEKTPSFVVSSERQIWHCFGCQKGGDCFTFLMEYEHMEFVEALRILAEKAGVTLTNQHFDAGLSSKKEKLYALNRLACEFYQYLLTKHAVGKHALAYVTKQRHISAKTLTTFQLGFAPSGNALVTYLMKKKGYTPEALLEAGLATRRGSLLVDFFQNRLMFPLFDHRENLIGFSGRVLQDSVKTSKYINTRETLVYHKGATFFGMPTAKSEMKKEGKAYLMEGEFDVISSFQEGIANAVAVKGTALTEDQVQLLSRFVQKVVLCFDMDNAGQEALRRSIGLLEKKALTIGALVLSQGKDPDEAIQKDKAGFLKAMKKDVPVYDFLLESTLGKSDPKTVEGKRQIGDELLPIFAGIENEIVKEHYLTKLGKLLGVSLESLLKELVRVQKKAVIKTPVAVAKVPRPRQDVLEEYLVALILQAEQPKELLSAVAPLLHDYQWNTPSLVKVLEAFASFAASHELIAMQQFAQVLPQELSASFDTCFLLPLPQFVAGDRYKQEALQVAKELYATYVKLQIKKIGDEIKKREQTGNTEGIELLQQQFISFLSQLAKQKTL